MGDLTQIVRAAAVELEHANENRASLIMEPVQAELHARGLEPGCWVGAGLPPLTPEQTVEWYAGQGVKIVQDGNWHCVNSWLNCVDKFAPEEPKP